MAATSNKIASSATILSRPPETAKHFKVSHMTLLRWRNQEGFPQPLKRGRVVLYNIAEIEQWLEGSAA